MTFLKGKTTPDAGWAKVKLLKYFYLLYLNKQCINDTFGIVQQQPL